MFYPHLWASGALLFVQAPLPSRPLRFFFDILHSHFSRITEIRSPNVSRLKCSEECEHQFPRVPNNILDILSLFHSNRPHSCQPRLLVSPKITRAPQEGVWCRGGSRNVEGWWRFLSLKMKRFQSFTVSQFQSKVSHYQSFKVHFFKASCFPKFQSMCGCEPGGVPGGSPK